MTGICFKTNNIQCKLIKIKIYIKEQLICIRTQQQQRTEKKSSKKE